VTSTVMMKFGLQKNYCTVSYRRLCLQVDLPRLIGRKGDNRVKLNVDDIFTLIARADELNILSKLPTFVATDPDKLPNMNPEALDVCILAKKLASLEKTVMRY